jgi:hypothetical protein
VLEVGCDAGASADVFGWVYTRGTGRGWLGIVSESAQTRLGDVVGSWGWCGGRGGGLCVVVWCGVWGGCRGGGGGGCCLGWWLGGGCCGGVGVFWLVV